MNTCNSIFKIQISLFILSLISVHCFAQDTDSVAVKRPPVQIGFVSEKNIESFRTDSIEPIDSSLSQFYLFDKFLYNITKEKNIFSAEPDNHQSNDIVRFSNDVMAPYKFSGRTIKYYKLNRRFSEVTYLQGSKSEQLLNIIYSQNIGKGLNVGLDFRRAGAEGFFRKQIFFQSSFDVFTHYEPPGKRYNLYAYYLRNHLEQQENGGIKDFNPAENSLAQPTNLSSAENKQTDKEFLLRQSYDWNKNISDTNKFLTTSRWQISHSIKYYSAGRIYSEASIDSFYQNAFLNSTSTNDSTWHQRWNNKFSVVWDGYFKLLRLPRVKSVITLTTGYEYIVYKMDSLQLHNEGMISQKDHNYTECVIVESIDNIRVSGYFRTSSSNREKGIQAWKKGISEKLAIRGEIDDKRLTYFFEEVIETNLLSITDRFYHSNHFVWFNEFPREKFTKYSVGISDAAKTYFVSGQLNKVENMFFYNVSAMPSYFNKSFKYYSITAHGNLKWRSWHLDNKILWQKSENEDVIHLPLLTTGHSLYLEKKVFRNRLFARIGTDVRYVSSYYADRYNPALQQFYIQNDEKTGGYLLTDLYVNFRIKASLFFIKAENLLNGISDKAYFYRPDYPVTPRVIRFGLQFRFYD